MRFLRPGVRCAAVAALVAAPFVTSCGSSGPRNFGAALVQILTTSIPQARTGQEDFSFFFQAAFPNPPGTYLVSGGNLPPGMVLDKDTGELRGVPRQLGTFAFQVAARDGNDPAFPPGRDQTFSEDRKHFTVQVVKGPPNLLPQVLPAAQYRFSYAHPLDAAGGMPPYAFTDVSVPPDGLGAGVSVSPSGVVIGFPTSSNGITPYPFRVQLTDADGNTDVQDLGLVIVVLPLTILTPSPLPTAAAEFPYAATLDVASPGAGVPYGWKQVTPVVGETLLSTIDMEISAGGVVQNLSGSPGPKKALSGPFVPPYTVRFTANVTDEALQPNVNRTYTLTVKPGPVLHSITPSKAAAPGPYVVSGLNFQSGAQLVFLGVGVNQTVTNPAFVNSTTLRLDVAPAAPGGITGPVTVRVKNPDGGFFDKPAGFSFPSTNLTFNGTPTLAFPASALSSTGLDVADANGDGFADIVHCGTSTGGWSTATGTAGGIDFMKNTPTGVGGAFNGNFTKVSLASGDWWVVKFSDVDTDGKPDIVAIGDPGTGPVIRTYLNSGNAATPFSAGSFTATPLPYTGNYTGHVTDMALGQFTGFDDSVPDLAYTHQDVSYTNTYNWYIYGGSVSTIQGGTAGAFGPDNLATQTSIQDLYAAASVATGNLNGDAAADLVVGDQVGSYGGAWWTGTGSLGLLGQIAMTDSFGIFGSWVPVTTASPNANGEEVLGIAVGDVTGDGRDDILFAADGDPGGSNWNTPATGMPMLGSYSQVATETFAEMTPIVPAKGYRYVTVFDGDFDLPLDVAVSGAPKSIDVYRGRSGLSGLLFKTTLTLNNSNIGRIAAGDFNKDGKPDLCAAMSFFADAKSELGGASGSSGGVHQDRGDGGTMNVGIFLNTSP